MTEKKTQTREEMVTELKHSAGYLAGALTRSLVRTGAVHLIGRKVLPNVFTSYGRTYAVVLLVDLLKAKRHVEVSSAPAKKADSKYKIYFREGVPTETEGYNKGDLWYAQSSDNSITAYAFDGTKWSPVATKNVDLPDINLGDTP